MSVGLKGIKTNKNYVLVLLVLAASLRVNIVHKLNFKESYDALFAQYLECLKQI